MKLKTPKTDTGKTLKLASILLVAFLVITYFFTPGEYFQAWLNPASASITENGYCIKAKDATGKYVAIKGAPNCGDTKEPTPVETPTIPEPEYTAAGICAAPGSENAVYALAGSQRNETRQIIEYSYTDGALTATGKNWKLDRPSADYTYNGLGLTRTGNFYLSGSDSFTGTNVSLFSYKPNISGTTGSLNKILEHGNTIGYIAGEAMVYKGHEEYYYARYTPSGLEVNRYSPVSERSGTVFIATIPGHSNKPANGDFAFTRNGDLRMIASIVDDSLATSTTVLASVPFKEFAEVKVTSEAPLLEAVSLKTFTVDRPVNGVAFLPDHKVVLSSHREITVWDLSDTPNKLSEVKASSYGPTDLANCH